MKILAIETSCDETAIALIEKISENKFNIIDNIVLSQAAKHACYGGVFPTLAKKEHSKNLPLILKEIAGEKTKTKNCKNLEKILEREPLMYEILKNFEELPNFDVIAVTAGPGLEPALWVGVNFANALSCLSGKKIIPINHMEGHIFISLMKESNGNFEIIKPSLPSLALLISGGHTQLVLMKDFGKYEILAETRDDAVGEAFDKVARLLGEPYPGGPRISALAKKAREKGLVPDFEFPRPLIKDPGMDFSFSGLKTAVRYFIQDTPTLTEELREQIALEFENAVADILTSKLKKALKKTKAKSVILGGGVSANSFIKEKIKFLLNKEFDNLPVFVSSPENSGDNALMIALAALNKEKTFDKVVAVADWKLGKEFEDYIRNL